MGRKTWRTRAFEIWQTQRTQNVEMTKVHMYKNNFTFENVHHYEYMSDKEVHSLWMNTFIFIISTYLLFFILYLLNMALFLCDIMCTEHKNFVSLVVIRRVLNLYEFKQINNTIQIFFQYIPIVKKMIYFKKHSN